jgi:DNA-binding FrmR family transcriptional regulator
VTASDVDLTSASHGYLSNKDDYLKRLRRIEGQARGLQRMVEQEQYCIDILTQVSAVTKALQSVALGLLDEHLSHCVVQAASEGGPGGFAGDRPPGALLTGHRARPTLAR